MNGSILRQIKDIQYQADKICTGAPSVVDIEDFGRYSNEIKSYIENNFELAELDILLAEIPNISKNTITLKSGILSVIVPNFLLYWFHERNFIERSKNAINTCKGKYASIEFILKNYY